MNHLCASWLSALQRSILGGVVHVRCPDSPVQSVMLCCIHSVTCGADASPEREAAAEPLRAIWRRGRLCPRISAGPPGCSACPEVLPLGAIHCEHSRHCRLLHLHGLIRHQYVSQPRGTYTAWCSRSCRVRQYAPQIPTRLRLALRRRRRTAQAPTESRLLHPAITSDLQLRLMCIHLLPDEPVVGAGLPPSPLLPECGQGLIMVFQHYTLAYEAAVQFSSGEGGAHTHPLCPIRSTTRCVYMSVLSLCRRLLCSRHVGNVPV
jgi:hypothetical protein